MGYDRFRDSTYTHLSYKGGDMFVTSIRQCNLLTQKKKEAT